MDGIIVIIQGILVTGVRQVCSSEGKIVGANWMGKANLFSNHLWLSIYKFNFISR